VAHRGAKLTPFGRLRIVQRVQELGTVGGWWGRPSAASDWVPSEEEPLTFGLDHGPGLGIVPAG